MIASRFETRRKPMARLDIKVGEDLLERLATFANEKGWTKSDAVRWVLEQGIDHAECRR